MVPNKEMPRIRRPWPWWRWILMALILLGLALSIYLSWHYLVDGTMVGCDGGSPCDQVLSSRWSAIGGVLPVSGLAAGVYLAMLISSLFIGPGIEAPIRRLAWISMLIIVSAAAGSAVWFIILQKWAIGAFCPYCMTAHITSLLLATLVIWRTFVQFDEDSNNITLTNPVANQDVSTAPRRVIRPLHAIGLCMLGLAMAGTLATCQVIFVPPVVYQDGQSQDNLPVIDPHIVPLVGSPDALYVVILLFDYNCPHCQQMHFMLNEVTRRYDGKLAFALCPAPLNKQCNPYITGEADEFKDSCELVKIGLTVWFANREVFPVFEDWMFSFESGDRWRPRSLEAAKAKAVELIGQAQFDAALANPWIDQYLQTSIQTYGGTIQTGNSAIPKLIFGSRWVIPQPSNIDELMLILHDNLAVPSHEL